MSGIWPPDVGGPASHAPEVAEFLRGRGHRVEALVTAERAPAPEAYPVSWVPRQTPVGLRHLRTARLVARRARHADVVYTTGMFGRTWAGCRLARTPYVLKLTGDPAFERARRRGLYAGGIEEFQHARVGPATRALRRDRDLAVHGARHVVCPSAYLRELALGWGVPAERVSVLPNPAPDASGLRSRDELRRELGFAGLTLVFAGRLTAQKSLRRGVDAVAAVDGVTLAIAGEGPVRDELERRAGELRIGDRVRFLGPLPRRAVLELFRAADAELLTSSWENFPHTVVEALAVGTPVIATAVGGVAEVVRDGENGLLVADGDDEALAAAVGRFAADEGLRERLRAASAPSVERYGAGRVYGELEQILKKVAR